MGGGKLEISGIEGKDYDSASLKERGGGSGSALSIRRREEERGKLQVYPQRRKGNLSEQIRSGSSLLRRREERKGGGDVFIPSKNGKRFGYMEGHSHSFVEKEKNVTRWLVGKNRVEKKHVQGLRGRDFRFMRNKKKTGKRASSSKN